MQQNPYASPKANVSTQAAAEPSEWQRAKWLFGGLWLLLTALPLFNEILQPRPTPDVAVLIVNSLVAVGLARFIARDMWLLKVRRSPLVVDIAAYVVLLGGLAFLIAVKETGLYVWNDLHLDIPIFLLMGLLALSAWITETKKGVRVYVGARHFIFLHDKVGL